MQPFRKGHQSNNKTVQKIISGKQRRETQLVLDGKKTAGTKKKPNKRGPGPKAREPYPCGPKQMAFGEAFG